MGIKFPTSAAVTTRSFIKRNENAVRKFIRGFVDGVHFAKTQRAAAIAIMKKYLRSSDAAMFDELYDMYIQRNIPRIPRPSPEALKTVLDQMAETDARVAQLKPEQFIDGRFFQELDKEGFIQKLWKCPCCSRSRSRRLSSSTSHGSMIRHSHRRVIFFAEYRS